MNMAEDVVIPAERIAQAILLIRVEKVLLDRELAKLYGVTTFNLNKAVKRNEARFPQDFMFQLTQVEMDALRFQIGTSKEVGRGGRRYLPYAFTEHGIAMLSSVLRSPIAAHVNIEIMRTFVRLRRLLATPGELAQQLTKLAETVELHDDQIRAITDVLQKMMSTPAAPEIGFHTIRRGVSGQESKS